MIQPERNGARRADAFDDASRIITASLSEEGRGHLSRLSSAALLLTLLLWHYHYTGDQHYFTPGAEWVAPRPGLYYPSADHQATGDYYCISGAPGNGYSSDYPPSGNNLTGDYYPFVGDQATGDHCISGDLPGNGYSSSDYPLPGNNFTGDYGYSSSNWLPIALQ